MLKRGNNGPDLEKCIPYAFAGGASFAFVASMGRPDLPGDRLTCWVAGGVCAVLWFLGLMFPIFDLLVPDRREEFRIRDVLDWIILGSIVFGPTFVRIYLR